MLTQTMHLELIGSVSIYIGLGIQVATSLILGGIVGLDREQKMKAAGLKTNILICIGAALYTSISMIVVATQAGGAVDPNRIGAQIVSGIGFLGAGAIFRSGGNVTGLTTAATIWVVAAIGYTIGAGYPFSAALFSITVLVVLKLIRPFNGMFEKKKDYQNYHLEVLSIGSIKEAMQDILNEEEIIPTRLHEIDVLSSEGQSRNRKIIELDVYCHYRAIERIISELDTLVRVEKSSFRTFTKEV